MSQSRLTEKIVPLSRDINAENIHFPQDTSILWLKFDLTNDLYRARCIFRVKFMVSLDLEDQNLFKKPCQSNLTEKIDL